MFLLFPSTLLIPFNKIFLTVSGKAFHGVVNEKLYVVDSLFMMVPIPFPFGCAPIGSIAPSIKLFFVSGMILSMSSSVLVPKPSQFEQAPKGELNEKWEGCNKS